MGSDQNKWGQININFQSVGAEANGGLPHGGVPQIVSPPLASAPTDWKLMLL